MSLESDVLRAIKELKRHPRGGKLEVYINTTAVVGERSYKILPLLSGTSECRGTTRTDDLD